MSPADPRADYQLVENPPRDTPESENLTGNVEERTATESSRYILTIPEKKSLLKFSTAGQACGPILRSARMSIYEYAGAAGFVDTSNRQSFSFPSPHLARLCSRSSGPKRIP